MGIGLFRHSEGQIDAIVSPKEGPLNGYLGQYRLVANASGRVDVTFVRRFGRFSGGGEIESVAVDDQANRVYYSDEGFGIREYAADASTPDAGRELSVFALDGYTGDREGIGIFAMSKGKGWIVHSHQLSAGQTEFRLYNRETPHQLLAVFKGGADETDGLEVTNAALGNGFPAGFLVAMNSRDKNYLIYDWRDLGRHLKQP